jgi:hypothetical protein
VRGRNGIIRGITISFDGSEDYDLSFDFNKLFRAVLRRRLVVLVAPAVRKRIREALDRSLVALALEPIPLLGNGR